MISPDASPLLAPIRITLHPLGVPEDTVAELDAWLAAHDIDPYATPFAFDAIHGIVVNRSSLTLWRHPHPATAITRPLTSHPSLGMLTALAKLGHLTCTALHRYRPPADPGEQTAELWECNVPVDTRGRHPGQHADGRYGDGTWWPNDDEGTAELQPLWESDLQPPDRRRPWRDLYGGDPAPRPAVDAGPAPSLTFADLQAAITRVCAPPPSQARPQVWEYTPPPDIPPGLGDRPMRLVFWDPALPPQPDARIDVWELADGALRRVDGWSR